MFCFVNNSMTLAMKQENPFDAYMWSKPKRNTEIKYWRAEVMSAENVHKNDDGI